MSDTMPLTIEGRIVDVFAHRFVVETTGGARILADLGPKGAASFALQTGIVVTLEGERKPSELKVSSIAREGGPAFAVAHGEKGRADKASEAKDHAHDADPLAAVAAVTTAGYAVLGAPRRKPKHFEVLGRKGAALVECHVDFDGSIRKEKVVAPDDAKWSSDLAAA